MFKRIGLITTLLFLLAGCMSVPTENDGPGSDVGTAQSDDGSYEGSVQRGQVSSEQYFLGNSYSERAPENQKYYFTFAQSDVHREYLASIRAQGYYLKNHPHARVRLEGNTDARGSREYNIGLGERRALSVAQILQMSGARKRQLVVVSYGEERPVAQGHDESAYRMNRRVDLIYEAKN